MFFKKSQLKKELEKVTELIRLGRKVYDYRHDVLPAEDAHELKEALHHLEKLKDKSDVSVVQLKAGHQRLHDIAKKCGGNIYPVHFLAENAEMILVAATLALGIRTFFLQPFAIPTNSMYPTFYGMTPKVYSFEDKNPNFFEKAFRTITLGSKNYNVKAPVSGEVAIPLFKSTDPFSALGAIKFEKVTGRKWFVLPTPMREYTFYVGDKAAKVRVPWDFRLEDVVQETYYPELKSFYEVLEKASQQRQIVLANNVPMIKTGKTLSASQSVIDFDILTGDMLFVDRFTYHFRYPKIGEPFVFKTIKIEGMRDFNGNPEDKYYIKRIVGIAGDRLEVREPTLYRNGEPIKGSPIFDLNTNKVGLYPGYTAARALSPGREDIVPEGYFYAMGDNSPHSGDSRYWGYVPDKEVIGKAFFIFYPFTKRWGFAK